LHTLSLPRIFGSAQDIICINYNWTPAPSALEAYMGVAGSSIKVGHVLMPSNMKDSCYAGILSCLSPQVFVSLGHKPSTLPGLDLSAPKEPLATKMDDAPRRQDYLHRLGIQKGGNDFRLAPASAGRAEGSASGPSEPTAPSSEGPIGGEPKRSRSDSFTGPEEDFRVAFLRKLSYEKVWVPQTQRSPKTQTVIIFDWDDTLLCTSCVMLQEGDEPLPQTLQRQLPGIEKAAARLLEMALQLGHTFIITNAMKGWVEYSAAKYMPGLLPILQKVRVISARDKHEAQYPNDIGEWKTQAFLEVSRQLDSQVITNLVSLGDADYEMDAVHAMGAGFERALVKTIKFRPNPSPAELRKQLELATTKFENIVVHGQKLKICLERRWPWNGAG